MTGAEARPSLPERFSRFEVSQEARVQTRRSVTQGKGSQTEPGGVFTWKYVIPPQPGVPLEDLLSSPALR